MPDKLQHALRSGVQILVGSLVAWLAARGLNVDEATQSVIGTLAFAAGVWLWGVLVHWLETRSGGLWKGLARVLMLGAGGKAPVYVKPDEVSDVRIVSASGRLVRP